MSQKEEKYYESQAKDLVIRFKTIDKAIEMVHRWRSNIITSDFQETKMWYYTYSKILEKLKL